MNGLVGVSIKIAIFEKERRYSGGGPGAAAVPYLAKAL
jgi:hypothetical protein